MKNHNCDKGAVTAELAVALPALVLVLIFGLLQLKEQAQRNAVEVDLAQYARALARQESETAVARWFGARHPSAHIKKSRQGGALCLKTEVPSLIGRISLNHCVWLGDY